MKQMFEKLNELNNSDMVPFHMPGHKRNPGAGNMGSYFGIDITETDDYDNLHDADGIILEAELRANKLYGAKETHFLVNGSTCGILAAISASVPKDGKIIAARNCHRSVYHAAYLRNLNIRFINPVKRNMDDEGNYIFGEIEPDDVEKSCIDNPDAAAIIITSPTYEGVPSDILSISKIAHKHGKILIIDEAHGAHFGLSEVFPENSIKNGADIVIHSVHKTLPSLTQTALIHAQGDLANTKKLRRFLSIYQSSSPSYILMTSIDSCIREITEHGEGVFKRVFDYKKRILEKTSDLKHLYVPGEKLIPDPCKVLICCKDGSVTGQQIYDILRLRYHIQLEMAGDFYGLAIITGYDLKENIDRLIKAMEKMDSDIESGKDAGENGKNLSGEKSGHKIGSAQKENIEDKISEDDKLLPETVIPFFKAWDADTKEIDISRASGKISGDFINLYPPGIPIILPGERFSKEIIEKISNYINTGRCVQGVEITRDKERRIKVIDSCFS